LVVCVLVAGVEGRAALCDGVGGELSAGGERKETDGLAVEYKTSGPIEGSNGDLLLCGVVRRFCCCRVEARHKMFGVEGAACPLDLTATTPHSRHEHAHWPLGTGILGRHMIRHLTPHFMNPDAIDFFKPSRGSVTSDFNLTYAARVRRPRGRGGNLQ
jgi:hypothetical protein